MFVFNLIDKTHMSRIRQRRVKVLGISDPRRGGSPRVHPPVEGGGSGTPSREGFRMAEEARLSGGLEGASSRPWRGFWGCFAGFGGWFGTAQTGVLEAP